MWLEVILHLLDFWTKLRKILLQHESTTTQYYNHHWKPINIYYVLLPKLTITKKIS